MLPYTGLAIMQYIGDPNGHLISDGAGQLCVDRTIGSPNLYQSDGAGSTTWQLIAGGGGGGITTITSNDNSVTITDPTGPSVDLSVAPSAGSIPGLSGVGDPISTNPTTADYIGQLYVDTSGDSGLWVAYGTQAGQWFSLGSFSSPGYGLKFGQSIILIDQFGDAISLSNGYPNAQLIGGYTSLLLSTIPKLSTLNGFGLMSLTIASGPNNSTYVIGPSSNITLPLTVVTGTNDTFNYNGTPYTVDAGVYNDILSLINALNTAGSPGFFATTSNLDLIIVGAEGDILTAGATDITSDLGFTNPDNATLSVDLLAFFDATPIGQQDAITPPSGGTVVDSECRTAVEALINLVSEAAGGFGFTA